MVTSRAPLRVAAEHELALGPLATEPAVALFLRRARAVDPRLELEPGDEERIARICPRLDGLPLAIELAAARIKVLSPAEILDRLSRRLDLLSSGPRDAPSASRPCAPRSAGAMTCSTRPRSACSRSSACSWAASRSKPPKPSAAPWPSTGSPRSPTTPDRARALLHESLELARDLADRNAIVEALETAAAVAADPRTGAIRPPDEQAWFVQAEAALRDALGDDGFHAALAEGADLGAEEAVARALAS